MPIKYQKLTEHQIDEPTKNVSLPHIKIVITENKERILKGQQVKKVK